MNIVDILIGDCRESLKELRTGSIDCCVTSPPYFGLRDYGVQGQVGLEKTASEYIKQMVYIFKEVFRVLKDTGVCFVNIGDTYAGFKDGKFTPQSHSNGDARGLPTGLAPHRNRHLLKIDGYRHKELMGIPWRFALAMRKEGWILRQDIIWSKPNYTPESVRDRFVRSHEHIFMFTKRSNYYFDGDACRVPAQDGDKLGSDVWTVPVSKYKGAHFATFPPELIEPCVKGGTPRGGIVLDPFGGSGTTAAVAVANGVDCILCELNPNFSALVSERISDHLEKIGNKEARYTVEIIDYHDRHVHLAKRTASCSAPERE